MLEQAPHFAMRRFFAHRNPAGNSAANRGTRHIGPCPEWQ
jgi:hypothetical protein